MIEELRNSISVGGRVSVSTKTRTANPIAEEKREKGGTWNLGEWGGYTGVIGSGWIVTQAICSCPGDTGVPVLGKNGLNISGSDEHLWR